MIIIGFDSEWVYLPEKHRNHILSYQFTVLTASSECSGIVYTEGPELKHRWKLSDLLVDRIQHLVPTPDGGDDFVGIGCPVEGLRI